MTNDYILDLALSLQSWRLTRCPKCLDWATSTNNKGEYRCKSHRTSDFETLPEFDIIKWMTL